MLSLRLGGEEVVAVVEVQDLQVGPEHGPGRADQVGRRGDRRRGDDDGRDVEDEPEADGPPHEPETRSSGKRSGFGRDRGIVGVDGHVAISDPRGFREREKPAGKTSPSVFPLLRRGLL